jgi:hypothetical protein
MFIGVSMGVRGCDEILDPSGCCGWERPGKEDTCSVLTSTTATVSPKFLNLGSSWNTGASDNSNSCMKEIYRSMAEFQVAKNGFDQEMKGANLGLLKANAERTSQQVDALAIIDECKIRQGLDLNRPAPLEWFRHQKNK